MTYSIVARDAATGAVGVAVQSDRFSVGAIVTWAAAGVGAVATQANVDWLVGEGEHDRAAERYIAAFALAPESLELRFWAGLSLLARGEREAGLAHVRTAVERHPGWGDLLERLGGATAPAAPEVRRPLGLG
jgi:tetratricopeptide (TPR) repeat protein